MEKRNRKQRAANQSAAANEKQTLLKAAPMRARPPVPQEAPAVLPLRAKPALTSTYSGADHTATKEVWVSKMVTVDDYETQTIYGAQFYTYGGVDESGNIFYHGDGPIYWFEDGFTQEDLKAIIYEGIKNADENRLV